MGARAAAGAGVSTASLPRGTQLGPALVEQLTSTDHKRVGITTIVTALVFFFLAGLLALVMRSELAAPGLQFLEEDTYNQVFTMHGSTMFFLFASPAVLGVALYMVPLQLGAAGIVWPRLPLAGYYMFLAGGVTMWSGFLTQNGAAHAAWHAFYPLTDHNESPWIGTDLWILGMVLSAAGVFLMAASVMATVVRRRAPGMTLMRMSLFTWSMVVTIFMILVAYPVLVVAMVLLFIDRNAVDIFSVPGGAVTWQHLWWFFAHPLVYVVFFPLVGAVGEIVATFSRRRYFGFSVTVVALLAFAALSTSVWGHHMFTQQTVDNRFYSWSTTTIAIPAGIEYFATIATMWGGRIHLRSPMLFALGFLLLFLIGGLTGVFVASPPLDYHVHDSYVVVGHFHYTLFGGTVFGLFAAIHYWFPKVTGRLLDERLAKAQALLMFAGALLTFIPFFFLGHDGMPREVADYAAFRGWGTLNVVSTVGAFTLLVAFLIFIVNVLRSRRAGVPSGSDPWEGHTLEWVADSPPRRHNFDALPPVRSFAPLLDIRHEGKDPLAVAAEEEGRPG